MSWFLNVYMCNKDLCQYMTKVGDDGHPFYGRVFLHLVYIDVTRAYRQFHMPLWHLCTCAHIQVIDGTCFVPHTSHIHIPQAQYRNMIDMPDLLVFRFFLPREQGPFHIRKKK